MGNAYWGEPKIWVPFEGGTSFWFGAVPGEYGGGNQTEKKWHLCHDTQRRTIFLNNLRKENERIGDERRRSDKDVMLGCVTPLERGVHKEPKSETKGESRLYH